MIDTPPDFTLIHHILSIGVLGFWGEKDQADDDEEGG